MAEALLFDFAKNNMESIAKEIIDLARELYAAYYGVSDNCERLGNKLIDVENLAMSISSCKGMPGDRILFELYCKFKEAKEAIIKFKKKEARIKKSRSNIQKFLYKVSRFFVYAHEYDAYFKDLNDALDQLPNELKRIRELANFLLEPNALAYKNQFVNEKCAEFWISIAGTEIGSRSDRWSRFHKKYILQYPESNQWAANDWDRIKNVACTGRDLTLFGYIDLTNKVGFPIELDDLPSTLDSNYLVDGASLIEIGKMINDLITKFSSKDMKDHIINVHNWYGCFEEHEYSHLIIPKPENETEEEEKLRIDEQKKAIKQFKANRCYELIIRIRNEKIPKDQWTEREIMAHNVEDARREISFFYQQFMVICEFGHLPRSIFKRVDFPGKSRIKAFIGDYRPLDYANYCIIINNGPVDTEVWNDKQPKVYKFLEEFLKDANNMETRKVSIEAKEKDLNEMQESLLKKEKDLELYKEQLSLVLKDMEDMKKDHSQNIAYLKFRMACIKLLNNVEEKQLQTECDNN